MQAHGISHAQKGSHSMKRVLALILALSLLVLCGCGNQSGETEPTTEPAESSQPTEESSVPEDTTPSEEPTEEVTEPPILYRNPLTGEAMDSPLTTRLLSASIGNTKAAMPTYGLSQADLVFEMFVNQLTTRLLGVYTDVSQVYAIGSMRSQRYHFTDISHSYDTIAISAGGSDKVMADVNRTGIDYMNVGTEKMTYYAFRDNDRHDNGYAWEHCLFALGSGLYEFAESKGYSTEFDQDKDYGMIWADDKALTDGQAASTVTVTFILSNAAKDSIFTYDSATGLYNFNQFKMDMTDPTTGMPVAFRNVFVILAETRTDSNGYHVSELVGSGEGYFACDGYMIPVQWHRETEDDVFSFTHTDGTPLEQGVGASYIAIAPTTSTVTAA